MSCCLLTCSSSTVVPRDAAPNLAGAIGPRVATCASDAVCSLVSKQSTLKLGSRVRRMHDSLSEDMRRYLACLAVMLCAACSEKPAPPARAHEAPQAAVLARDNQPDSARAFVQGFYDWYLATEAQKGSPYDSLLAGRCRLLGDSLAAALDVDIAAQRADSVAEIASLSSEADVFLDYQDPCPHYTARPPRATGPGRFAVLVAGDCAGLDVRPNLEVHVRSTPMGWQIQNIKDPTNPSFDLLGALVRYHAGSSHAHSRDDAT